MPFVEYQPNVSSFKTEIVDQTVHFTEDLLEVEGVLVPEMGRGDKMDGGAEGQHSPLRIFKEISEPLEQLPPPLSRRMNIIKEIQRINQKEAELGIAGGKGSWHDRYKDSAYIFVGGLDYELTEGDIICVFEQYGKVIDINLVRDKETGKSKGYAFLCYEDQRSTITAVDNFNGIRLSGRMIRVDHVAEYKHKKKEEDKEKEEKMTEEEKQRLEAEAIKQREKEEKKRLKMEKKALKEQQRRV
jgi:RNA-binding motif X-linked protein 2